MTTSFPAVGLGGISADAWASTFGSRDGVVEDYTGDAFAMTLLGSNEASFTAGRISVNGYTLVVADDERVSLPAPTSGSKTYYIGALYDPALQVPLAGTGTDPITNPPLADPAGPCRLQAYDGAPTLTNGQKFLVCYTVTRTSSPLTGASKVDRRRWVGVVLDYPNSQIDATPGNEGDYPRGSMRLGTNGIEFRTVSGGVLVWAGQVQSSSPVPLPMLTSFVARAGKGAPPQFFRFAGNQIGLEGQLQRSSGNLSNGNTVELGTMPAGSRPGPGARAWICRCGGTNNYTEVRVNSDGTTDGKILMADPPSTTTWLDLSPISYRIGA